MKKKSEFEAPYIGIETIDNTPIFYNRRGDYSVIIKCENPIIQYSADMDAYYDFHHLFTNILKVLGTGLQYKNRIFYVKNHFYHPRIGRTTIYQIVILNILKDEYILIFLLILLLQEK